MEAEYISMIENKNDYTNFMYWKKIGCEAYAFLKEKAIGCEEENRGFIIGLMYRICMQGCMGSVGDFWVFLKGIFRSDETTVSEFKYIAEHIVRYKILGNEFDYTEIKNYIK